MVNASSLRQELGLKLHNVFENGVHHGNTHSETLEPDVEDADHEASAAPQTEQDWIDPSRLPSLDVKIHDPEHFYEAVVDYEINTDLQST